MKIIIDGRDLILDKFIYKMNVVIKRLSSNFSDAVLFSKKPAL